MATDVRRNLELMSSQMARQMWKDQMWTRFVSFANRQIEVLERGIFAMPPMMPVPLPMEGNLNYKLIAKINGRN